MLGNWTDSPCWYVSVQDAGKTGLVLGPFQTEQACREYAYCEKDGGNHAKHYWLVEQADSFTGGRAWFYSWGMVKMVNGYRSGVLTEKLFGELWNGGPVEIPAK